MIVIREIKCDCCRACVYQHPAPGVLIEYCGVREFHCLDSFHAFLSRLIAMPGVVSVLAAQASGTANPQALAQKPLKLGQKI